MRKITEAVSLFYSSTEDSQAEIRKARVESTLRLLEQSRNVAIRMIYWKDNIPGGLADHSGQSRINLQVYKNYDIYFGCMGPKYGKGTVEEFANAVESHIKNRTPAEVLFAFDETPINPFIIPDDFDSVKMFRRNIQDSTKYGRSLLYFTFDNMDVFSQNLFRDLNAAITKVTSRVSGGPPPIL